MKSIVNNNDETGQKGPVVVGYLIVVPTFCINLCSLYLFNFGLGCEKKEV